MISERSENAIIAPNFEISCLKFLLRPVALMSSSFLKCFTLVCMYETILMGKLLEMIFLPACFMASSEISCDET